MRCFKMVLTANNAFKLVRKARHNYKLRDERKQASYAYRCEQCVCYHITTHRSAHNKEEQVKRIRARKNVKNWKL